MREKRNQKFRDAAKAARVKIAKTFDVSDLAKIAGVYPSTVRYAIKTGRLAAWRRYAGSAWEINLRDAIAYVQGEYVAATSLRQSIKDTTTEIASLNLKKESKDRGYKN